MPTPDNTEPTTYRLTDIDTEEVSVVDRAANRRKFLIVKGADMAKGAAITSDGKGGHTVVKDAPATPPATPPTAAPTPAPAPTPEPSKPAEPVLALSPEAKAELIKRVTTAAERLSALKSLVEGATESLGLLEVPNEIALKFSELLTGLAQGEVEKGAAVAKGLPQFSSARTSQLLAARDAIDAVLSSVAKPTTPEPAPEPAAPAVDDSIAKALAAFETRVATALDKITTVVASQGETIAKQAAAVATVAKGQRELPQSSSAPGQREGVDKGDEDEADEPGGWPSDMADPDKHDVKKVDPSVRFTTKR